MALYMRLYTLAHVCIVALPVAPGNVSSAFVLFLDSLDLRHTFPSIHVLLSMCFCLGADA